MEFGDGNDRVGESDTQCFVGLHLTTAEDDLFGDRRTDEPGQPLCAAATGNDAQQDLGLPERGVVGGNTQIACECELASTTEGKTGDRRDDDTRNRFEGPCRLDKKCTDGTCFVGTGEFGDVRAGGEDALTAGDDDRSRRVGNELECRETHAIEHGARERVDLRIVEADDRDVVVIALEMNDRHLSASVVICRASGVIGGQSFLVAIRMMSTRSRSRTRSTGSCDTRTAMPASVTLIDARRHESRLRYRSLVQRCRLRRAQRLARALPRPRG